MAIRFVLFGGRRRSSYRHAFRSLEIFVERVIFVFGFDSTGSVTVDEVVSSSDEEFDRDSTTGGTSEFVVLPFRVTFERERDGGTASPLVCALVDDCRQFAERIV